MGIRRTFVKLTDNRWLYIGWTSDDWGRRYGIDISLWRRDR